MKIQITITTDNAAFADDWMSEVERILAQFRLRAQYLEKDYLTPKSTTPIRDINGNRCGEIAISEDRR
jgi:hypothetical protein